MSKRFIFNKEDLKFSETKTSFSSILWLSFRFVLLSILIAVIYYVVFSLLFNTKQEKMLAAENEYLERTISDMESKSELIDDVIENLKARDRDIYRDIFNADPPIVFSDDASDSIYNLDYIDSRTEAEIIRNVHDKVQSAEIGAAKVESNIALINRVMKDSAISCQIPCIIPLKSFSIAQTGASVGMKINPFYKTLLRHEGVDLMAPVGTDVLASADGIVVEVERAKKGKGNFVAVEHAGGMKTVYAHLGDIYVRSGQKVRQRTVIARTGNSGTVFAPSLHYEVIKDGTPQDPIDYFFADISPAVYREMMMISRNTGQSMD